jgi:ATP-dependent helicase/nuclease subunit B
VLRGLWQPRIRRALAWTEEEIHRQSSQGRTVLLAEEWGSMQLSHVTLKGKVDRIDRLSDGSLAIVDYKTGGAPSKTKIASGFAPQLGLLGLIARESGFNANKGIPTRFEYWSMAKDGSSFGRVSSALSKNEDGSEAAMQLVDRAKDTVLGVIARWIEGDEPFTAKLHPEYAVGSDYDQLMRLKEWYGREGQFDDG